MTFHFTLEEKLFVAGGCATAVVLFGIILACKVSPYCCLYRRCPLRARYDELKDRSENDRRKWSKYRQLNYAKLAPLVPTVTLTSLEKSNAAASAAAAMTLVGPTAVSLPAYTATPVDAKVPCKIQHLRSHKGSTSSLSGSSDSGPSPAPPVLSSSSGVGSTLSSECGDPPIPPQHPPLLNLSIGFNDIDEKLIIHVIGAQNVPVNIYGGANDSYVHILVVKDLKGRWRRRSNITTDEILQFISTWTTVPSSTEASPQWSSPSHHGPYEVAEYKTQLIRRKLDPVFNEHFVVDVKQKEKKYTFVKFILRSVDRFSHHWIAGTAHVDLASLPNGRESLDTGPVCLTLRSYTPDLGEMLLSLCYLPTAERLHVNVMKINNLKAPPGSNTANPFVKAMVIRRGKVLEKHNTPVQYHTLNPVFNEALIFDVPYGELEKITLLLTVVHQDTSDVAEIPIFHDSNTQTAGNVAAGRRSSSANGVGRKRGVSVRHENGESPEGEYRSLQKIRSIHSLKSKPCSILARVAFGSLAAVQGSCRCHWQEMLKWPRKQVAQWHKLQP